MGLFGDMACWFQGLPVMCRGRGAALVPMGSTAATPDPCLGRSGLRDRAGSPRGPSPLLALPWVAEVCVRRHRLWVGSIPAGSTSDSAPRSGVGVSGKCKPKQALEGKRAMKTDQIVIDPVRFDPATVTAAMAADIADRAAALMAVPLVVEVAKVARPDVRYGALVIELTSRAAEDVAAELVRRWPELPRAVDGELCVLAAIELVNDWADSLLGAAMEAARIGGDPRGDDVAA